ncbi:hypothetical protein D021_0617A, partial [Vibrio parahaemolyticus 10296]
MYITSGMRNKHNKPGTIAAVAQPAHVISTPCSFAKLAASGLP